MDLGKVDGEFLRETVYPRLGADREDVRVGPTAGVDFGVLDVDGQALVIATDPLSLPPGLGFERAGRFALGAGLSFIGVGVQPPQPGLGTMVSEGTGYLPKSWWFAIFPGAAIFLLVMGFNMLGDGLRDVFDVEVNR